MTLPNSMYSRLGSALLAALVMSFLFACNQHTDRTQSDRVTITTRLKYAEGFTVRYEGKVKHVEVTYPYQGATSGYRYLLVPAGTEVPPHDNDVQVIQTPVQSIICTSTTHIPLLTYLHETDALIGFPTLDYISATEVRARIDAGRVRELGVDKGLNIELIATLKPDLLMGYTMTGDNGQFKKIQTLGVPVVMNAEYLEKDPLGRAEWIKFMALFFDKEAMADSVFGEIEAAYLKTKELTSHVEEQPTVMSGIVYGDAWFLPGGENYAAKLFKDAGCRYLWGDDTSNGFLELSFESVYERAHDADLWIGVGSFKSLEEIRNADTRYGKFKPFLDGQVYTYNARVGAKGGSEFLELGYLRPDLILNDLVKIAHPDLMPDYTLFFHGQLE